MALLLIPIGLWLIVLGFRVWGQPLDRDRVSYWQKTVEGLDEAPDVFFAQIYQALKEGLATRDVQLSGMGFGPTKLFETHSILSSRPLYLQAKYKHLSCYLFLGQTPTGFFLSSRTYNKFVKGQGERSILSYAALKYFQRQTMFQYDASLMFIESVHAIVLTVLDSYIEEKNLKPLEEYERRPILHAFYANAYPPKPQQMWALPMQAVPMQGRNSSNPTNPAQTPDPGIVPVPNTLRVLPLEPDITPPMTPPITTTASETTDQIAKEVAEPSIRYDGTDDFKSDDFEINGELDETQAGDDMLSLGNSLSPEASITVQPAETQRVHEGASNMETETFEHKPIIKKPGSTSLKTDFPKPEVEKPQSGRILPL